MKETNLFWIEQPQEGKTISHIYHPNNTLGAVLKNAILKKSSKENKKIDIETKANQSAREKKGKHNVEDFVDADYNLYPLAQNEGYNNYIVKRILKPLGLKVAIDRINSNPELYLPVFAFYKEDSPDGKLYYTSKELKKDFTDKLLKDPFFNFFDRYRQMAMESRQVVKYLTKNPVNKVLPKVARIKVPTLPKNTNFDFINQDKSLAPYIDPNNAMTFGGLPDTMVNETNQIEDYNFKSFNPTLHNLNLRNAYYS
jgi:hypothetical protein